MTRSLLAVGILTLVYALVLGSFDLWDLLTGALLAIGLMVVFRNRLRDPSTRPIRPSAGACANRRANRTELDVRRVA